MDSIKTTEEYAEVYNGPLVWIKIVRHNSKVGQIKRILIRHHERNDDRDFFELDSRKGCTEFSMAIKELFNS